MEVLRHLTLEMFMPGDYIVRTGEVGDSMYFIRSGHCKILVPESGPARASIAVSYYADVTSSKGQVCHRRHRHTTSRLVMIASLLTMLFAVWLR